MLRAIVVCAVGVFAWYVLNERSRGPQPVGSFNASYDYIIGKSSIFIDALYSSPGGGMKSVRRYNYFIVIDVNRAENSSFGLVTRRG